VKKQQQEVGKAEACQKGSPKHRQMYAFVYFRLARSTHKAHAVSSGITLSERILFEGQ